MRSERQRSDAVSKPTLLADGGVLAKLLGNVKPIPAWADGALSRYGVELREAYKAKDSYRIKRAECEIARIRSKVGLAAKDMERKVEGLTRRIDARS